MVIETLREISKKREGLDESVDRRKTILFHLMTACITFAVVRFTQEIIDDPSPDPQ